MSSERSSKTAPELPDLDQLAALVDADAPPSSVTSSGDRPDLPAEGGEEEVDDSAPTDYYHSVKPKPKAVPIAEVGTDDQPELQEEQPKRYVWAWLLAALLLTVALAVAGLLHHQQPLVSNAPASQPAATNGDTARTQGGAQGRVSRQGSAEWDPSGPFDSAQSGLDVNDQAPAPGAAVPVQFERRGQAILVPVRLKGPSGARSVKMVLDTGATFSTVTDKTLAALGVEPTRVNAKVETANGLVTRPLAVVDAIALEGASVSSGLTVGVCNGCAPAGTEGLLGLNFARHFVVTVDHDAGRLLLAPKFLGDKTMDIRPFVTLLDAKSERRADRVAIRFSIRNKAPRALRSVVIEATSPGLPTKPRTTIARVAAGGRTEATIEGAVSVEGGARTFTLEVVRASW